MSKQPRPRGRRPSERRPRGMPPIPPKADLLRDAHKYIDPHHVYALEMPDRSFLTITGADLIQTADAITALVDAHRAGDRRSIARALTRIAELP